MPTLSALEAKLDRAIASFEGHVRHCEESNRLKETAFDKLATKIDTIEKLPMKAVRWIGTLVIGAAITQLVTVYVTNHEAAERASQAVQAAQTAAAVSKGQGAAISKQLSAISAAQTNATGAQP